MYKDKAWSVALYHFRGNEAAAADAVQQAFVKLFSSIERFRGDSEFATWFYRILWNCCVDARRRDRVWRSLDELQIQPRAEGSHTEDYAQRQTAEWVRAAVASLKPHLRWPILLRYFEDLSYMEIGAVLRCSEGAIASRLNRAHRMLARKLGYLLGRAGEGK